MKYHNVLWSRSCQSRRSVPTANSLSAGDSAGLQTSKELWRYCSAVAYEPGTTVTRPLLLLLLTLQRQRQASRAWVTLGLARFIRRRRRRSHKKLHSRPVLYKCHSQFSGPSAPSPTNHEPRRKGRISASVRVVPAENCCQNQSSHTMHDRRHTARAQAVVHRLPTVPYTEHRTRRRQTRGSEPAGNVPAKQCE